MDDMSFPWVIYTIIMAIAVMLALIAWNDISNCRSLHRLFWIHDDAMNDLQEIQKKKLKQVEALNAALTHTLSELLHTDSKQTLRWKFHVIRKIEPYIKTYAETGNETMYELIMKIITSDVKTREEFMMELRLATKDYYMLDLEDGEPLLDLFQHVMDIGAEIDEAVEASATSANKVIEAAKAINNNFEILDTDPLGPMPNTRDAEKLRGAGPMSREETLERLIALASEMPPVVEETAVPGVVVEESNPIIPIENYA